ncbi:hypothetical protein MSAN_02472300 [Mycena sanguinolenta]|uniref:Uncharacterized protein n=1 Tax=Mycena sanguinolenta TaxID=230812 RepID=A0A8H6WUG3_9AGAR|nr:hypothetical protein MSAN_02472300 [Mycena sanguinolenta]
MISSKFPRDEWYAPPTPPASPIVDPSLLHPLPVPIAAWILFNVAGDASCRREKSRRAATDTSPKCDNAARCPNIGNIRVRCISENKAYTVPKIHTRHDIVCLAA